MAAGSRWAGPRDKKRREMAAASARAHKHGGGRRAVMPSARAVEEWEWESKEDASMRKMDLFWTAGGLPHYHSLIAAVA